LNCLKNESIICDNTFKCPNNPTGDVPQPPFYKGRSWGSERLSTVAEARTVNRADRWTQPDSIARALHRQSASVREDPHPRDNLPALRRTVWAPSNVSQVALLVLVARFAHLSREPRELLAPGAAGWVTARGPCVLSPQLGFEDVIAEPVTTHSFDKVWVCSHALFEISKYVMYKFLTVFLAIPLAFAAGILFATLSCLHIWILMPFVKTCLMVLPSVQTIWKSVTDVVIAPLCTSVGRTFSSVSLQLSHD
ncbi:PREDICTED: caveolin-2, partial [Galeopterus variegatus]|uniref:Caveolin n=1 Tax=Galeopterus variegatus TaxID=482537 RepID=A0ABM0RF88_GALVR